MKKTTHNKLVRDKIPNILIKKGLAFKASKVSSPEMRVKLADKLIEEATEVRDKVAWFYHLGCQEPMSNAECDDYIDAILEEMADVLEVYVSLAKEFEINTEDIFKTCDLKRKECGGFEDGIYVEWIEDKGDN